MNSILLSYILGRIANIADASPSDIQTSVLGGSIALNNVRLRADTLNALLPLPIEEGKIARLTLKVPNPRTSDPLMVEAESARVVFQLDLSKAETDPTKEERLNNITSASILGTSKIPSVDGDSASSHGDPPDDDHVEMSSSGIASEEEDLVSCLSENDSISESESGAGPTGDDGQGTGASGGSGGGIGGGFFSFLRDKAMDSVEWIWHRQIKIFSKNIHITLPCDTRNEMKYEAVVEQFQVIVDPTEKLNAVEQLKVVTLLFKNAVVYATTPTGEARVVSVPSLEVKLTSVYANGVLVRKNSVILFDETVSLFADETSLFALMKCQATRAATLLVPVYCRRFLPLRRERSLWRYAFCSAIEMIHDKKRRFNYNPSHLQFYSQARRRYVGLLESCHRQQRITEYREELAEVEEDLRYPDVILFLRHYVQRRYNAAPADALVAEERKIKDNSVRTSLHLDTKKVVVQFPSKSTLMVDDFLMAFRNDEKTVSVQNVSLSSSNGKVQSFNCGAPESRIFSMEINESKGRCNTKVLLEPISIRLRSTDICQVVSPFVECLHSVEVKYSASCTAAPTTASAAGSAGASPSTPAPAAPGSLIVALPELRLQLDSFLLLVSHCTVTRSVALTSETKYGAVVKTFSIEWNKDFLLLPVEVSMQPSGDVVVSELNFVVTHPLYNDFAAIHAKVRELVEQVPDHVWALCASPPATTAESATATLSRTDFAPWMDTQVWQREKNTPLTIFKGLRLTCEPFNTSVAVHRTEISMVLKEKKGTITRALGVRCARVEVSARHFHDSELQVALSNGFELFSVTGSALRCILLPSCQVDFVMPGLTKDTARTCALMGVSEMHIVALDSSNTVVCASQLSMVDDGVVISAFECLVKSDTLAIPTCRAPYRASFLKLSMELQSVRCQALLNAPLDCLVPVLSDVYEYLCANVIPENMYQLFFSGYSDLDMTLSAKDARLFGRQDIPLRLSVCQMSNNKAKCGFAQCGYTGEAMHLTLTTRLKDLLMILALDPFQVALVYTADTPTGQATNAAAVGARIGVDGVSCTLPLAKMPFWEERVQQMEVTPTRVSCDRLEVALFFENNEQLLSCTVSQVDMLSAVEELSAVTATATRSPSDSDTGGSSNRSFGGGGGGGAMSKGKANSTAVDVTECSLYVCPAVSSDNWCHLFSLCQILSSGCARIVYHVETASHLSGVAYDLGRAGKDVFFYNRHAIIVVEDSTFVSYTDKRRLVICDETTVVFRRCTFSFSGTPFKCVSPTAVFLCEDCTFTRAPATVSKVDVRSRSQSKSGAGSGGGFEDVPEGQAAVTLSAAPDLFSFALNVHEVTAKVQVDEDTSVLYSQRRLSCTYKEIPGHLMELHVHSKKAMSYYYEKQCKIKVTHMESAQFFLQHNRRRDKVVMDTSLCISAVRLPLATSVLNCVNRVQLCYSQVTLHPSSFSSRASSATGRAVVTDVNREEDEHCYACVKAAAASVCQEDFVDPFHIGGPVPSSPSTTTVNDKRNSRGGVAACAITTGGTPSSGLSVPPATTTTTIMTTNNGGAPSPCVFGVRKWQCHVSTTKCAVDVLLVNHTTILSLLISSALFFSSKETAEENGNVECRGGVEYIELLNSDVGQCERVTSQPIVFSLDGSLSTSTVSLRCKVDNSVVLLQTAQVKCLLALLTNFRQLNSLAAVRIENESGLPVELNRIVGEHVSVDESLCLYKPIPISVGPSTRMAPTPTSSEGLTNRRNSSTPTPSSRANTSTYTPVLAGRLYTKTLKTENDLTVESYMDTCLVHHIIIRTFVSVVNRTDMELTLSSNENTCVATVAPYSTRSIPVPLLDGGKLWSIFVHPITKRRTMRAPLLTCEGTASTSVAQLLRRKLAKTICSGDAEDDVTVDHVELVDERDGSSLFVRMLMEMDGAASAGGGGGGLRLVLASECATLINACPLSLSVTVSSNREKETTADTKEQQLTANGGVCTFYPSAKDTDYVVHLRFVTRNLGTFSSTKSIPLWEASATTASTFTNSSNGSSTTTLVGTEATTQTRSTGSIVAKSDKGKWQMEVCFTRERKANGVACVTLSTPLLYALEDHSGVPLTLRSDNAVLTVEEEEEGAPQKMREKVFLIGTDEREEVVLEAVPCNTSRATLCVCECLNGTCAVLPVDGTSTSHVCLVKPCAPLLLPSATATMACIGGWGGSVHLLPPLVLHNEGCSELTVRQYVLKKDVSPSSTCPVACELKVGANAVQNHSTLANAGYTNWFLLSCAGNASRDYVSITICPGARWKGFVKCGNHFHKVVFQKDGLLDSGHLSITGRLPPPVKVVNVSSQVVAKMKPLSVVFLSSTRSLPFPVTSVPTDGSASALSASVSSSLSATAADAFSSSFFMTDVGSAAPVYAFPLIQGKQQCVYLINAGASASKTLHGCGVSVNAGRKVGRASFTLRATFSNTSVALRPTDGLVHASLPLLSVNVSSARGVVDCVCSASGLSLTCSSTEAAISAAPIQVPPVLSPFNVSLSVMALRFLEDEDVEIGSASVRCAPLSVSLSTQFITLAQKVAAELYVAGGAAPPSASQTSSPQLLLLPPPPPVWYVSVRCLEVSTMELSCHWDRVTAVDLPNWGPCSFLLRFVPSMQFFEMRLPPLSTSFPVAKPVNVIAGQLKSFYLSELISQIPSAASSFSFSQRKNGLVHFFYTRLGFLFGISPPDV